MREGAGVFVLRLLLEVATAAAVGGGESGFDRAAAPEADGGVTIAAFFDTERVRDFDDMN